MLSCNVLNITPRQYEWLPTLVLHSNVEARRRRLPASAVAAEVFVASMLDGLPFIRKVVPARHPPVFLDAFDILYASGRIWYPTKLPDACPTYKYTTNLYIHILHIA